ncbi:hypothetical protein MHW47_07070 [Streptomyces sp. OfavH-34-F]|uniref:hypothetical protein n=1 Tax=Streptomyces sp. OfavH-34-F TaxID=2917760 RepID=UPI001EF2C69C|nr:hypothetical protein [Streptomyces sp. OfavH-34-F]MCG7524205.1 hypothetical protein [Streptomyces sp. OfavH-34-F]
MVQVTGDGNPQEEGPKPVRTRLLKRAVEVARLIAGLAQAAYYTLKTLRDL